MSGPCPWPVHGCMDDICRNSVERGLCGKWVDDDVVAGGSDDDWDVEVDHWDECCETGVCE